MYAAAVKNKKGKGSSSAAYSTAQNLRGKKQGGGLKNSRPKTNIINHLPSGNPITAQKKQAPAGKTVQIADGTNGNDVAGMEKEVYKTEVSGETGGLNNVSSSYPDEPLGKQRFKAASSNSYSPIQRRLPPEEEIKPAIDAGHLKALKKALLRMENENRVLSATKHAVDMILAISSPMHGLLGAQFPGFTPAVSTYADTLTSTDAVAWRILLETVVKRQPDQIYSKPEEAEAKLKGTDATRMVSLGIRAKAFFEQVAAGTHDAHIQKVFGAGKLVEAKKRFTNAYFWLNEAYKFNAFDTDYHGDDTEMNLGGYAVAGTKIHFSREFFTGSEDDALITLVHEGSHLGNADVKDDGGYAGTPGFDTLHEDLKLINASHFEEVMRRVLGKSSYGGKTFVYAAPSGSVGGGGPVMTKFEEAQRLTSEQFRIAWTAGFRMQINLRNYRKAHPILDKAKNPDEFGIVEYWSSIMGLTFHKQGGTKRKITNLDLALAEGLTRKLNYAMNFVPRCSAKKDEDIPDVIYRLNAKSIMEHNITVTFAAVGKVRATPARNRQMLQYMGMYADNALGVPKAAVTLTK